MNWNSVNWGEVFFLILIGVASIRADVLLSHIARTVELIAMAKGLLPSGVATRLSGGTRETRTRKDKWMAHEINDGRL